MTRYAAAGITNCGRDAINEFKTLVREAHKLGIEVFMDVVFNHTAEGNEMGPTISFRGFDNRVYYMIAPKVYTTTSRSHLQSCYLCCFIHHSGF
jgi:isoamylase